MLRADTGRWVAEELLYRVPNEAAMETLSPALLESMPGMATSPAELLGLEVMRNVGAAQKAYTDAVIEITAAP